MFALIAHVFAVIGENVSEVGSGGSNSPLSANSVYSEILRMLQLGMFLGVAYIVKEFKGSREKSSDAHSNILGELAEVKQIAENNYEANRKLIETIQSDVKRELEAIHQDVKPTP